MRKLYERIGSPSALFAFEAAARHLSFTKAAEELNVSQPAISLSVKRIEEALGVRLFYRQHRAIELTEAGAQFHNDVSFGLMQIYQSAERVALKRQSSHVTLSMSTAFANYWMVPRLATFRTENPEVDIRLQTTDKDMDLATEAVALEIRQGSGDWPGCDAHRLADEIIYPVCSPSHLARISPPRDADELMSCDLIHLEEPYRARPTWGEWFANQGAEFTDRGEGLRLNDYALVIQAAIAGQGIAMGWQHLVGDMVKQGLLVRVLDLTYAEGAGFYVVWSKLNDLSTQAERVLDWLKAQTAEGC